MVKRNLILICIGIIIILVLIYLINLNNKELSNKELFEIVKPEVDNYCSEIRDVFNENKENFSIMCATCGSLAGNEYKEVECSELEDYFRGQYCISKEGGNHSIKVIVPLAWGGYNNKPGSSPIIFTLNKDGQIVNKEIFKKSCMI